MNSAFCTVSPNGLSSNPPGRFLWAGLCVVYNDWRSNIFLVKASTVIGWHRKAFRVLWARRIRCGKRAPSALRKEIRVLIRTMSRDNLLWVPRIHGELLKLDIDIDETSVSKYIVRYRRPPAQTGRLPGEPREEYGFHRLLHCADYPVSDILCLPVLAHQRHRILHFAVGAYPTIE
jgi:hypothetical protein